MSSQDQKRPCEVEKAHEKVPRGEKRPYETDAANEEPSRGEKRPRQEDEAHAEASRPRKRPGGASRISRAEAVVAEQLKQKRAAEAAAANSAIQIGGVGEAVRQHYNAVPERGRDWRKTDSKIRGLRTFNNWVKSTVIHKFSPGEPDSGPLRILDIGCGKGGDLQKWQRAPQPVELYVGIDPAEVSIDQARERYRQMRSRSGGSRGGRGDFNNRSQRLFDAEFLAEDAFSFSLGDLQIIQEVGFGPGSRWGPAGGFDVVSMMFCMHYAFENEAKAMGMLNNVAGSLKKGGRFFGVIPNSDVLRDGITKFHKRSTISAAPGAESETKTANPKKAIELNGTTTPPINGLTEAPGSALLATNGTEKDESSSKETEVKQRIPAAETTKTPEPTTAEWGNSIYRVRFPGETPKDGIFRPPYGWKYSYFMEEAVEEVPEYVVPWEAFRAIAEDYNLELQYRRPFADVWEEEKNSPVFGPLSEQMGVRGKDAGPLLITDEELEAASFYHAFCFYKI